MHKLNVTVGKIRFVSVSGSLLRPDDFSQVYTSR